MLDIVILVHNGNGNQESLVTFRRPHSFTGDRMKISSSRESKSKSAIPAAEAKALEQEQQMVQRPSPAVGSSSL